MVNFDRIDKLIAIMESHTHIRYIGFPSSTNTKHAKSLLGYRHLDALNKPPIRIDIDAKLCLQPLVYWYIQILTIVSY